MGDPVAVLRTTGEQAELEPLNPDDGFRAILHPTHHEATFDVLVRDRLSRDPLTYDTFPLARPQEESFILTRNIYQRRSGLFREKLTEAAQNTSDPNTSAQIILENHVPDDFDAYMQYVTTGSRDIPMGDGDDPLFPLLRRYVLADQLGDFTFANLIINDIMRVSNELNHVPSKKEIWFVWQKIEEFDHPLKRLFVDYQIHEAPRMGLIFEEYENIPFDYLNDVVLEYWGLAELERKRRRDGREDVIFGVACSGGPMCHYHQHDRDSHHLSCEALGFSRGAGGTVNERIGIERTTRAFEVRLGGV